MTDNDYDCPLSNTVLMKAFRVVSTPVSIGIRRSAIDLNQNLNTSSTFSTISDIVNIGWTLAWYLIPEQVEEHNQLIGCGRNAFAWPGDKVSAHRGEHTFHCLPFLSLTFSPLQILKSSGRSVASLDLDVKTSPNDWDGRSISPFHKLQ
jgi:hypothetical protein